LHVQALTDEAEGQVDDARSYPMLEDARLIVAQSSML
jgi:hypothetical protein